MNRSTILVVVATAALGLAAGFLGSGRSTVVTPHSVRRPPAAGEPDDSGRAEFPLGPEDVANDRETPAVAADAKGNVVLAWAKQSGEDERSIMLARSVDDGRTFAAPVAFRKVPIYRYASKGKSGVMFSTHVLPRLVATAGGIVLGWVEATKDGPPVHYYVATSTDGGATFGPPVSVHGESAVKPGFTTLSAAPDGTLGAAWIDARNKAQQPFFAAKSAGSEGFEAERMAFAGPDGKGICPCCDLAALRLPDGSDVVAFRNSDSGHRDIWIARAPAGGAFPPPRPIGPDRWTFDGCPHDGPSLALAGYRMVAAWMSGHSGRNRVYCADTAWDRMAFDSSPRELSPGTAGAQGHPRLVATGAGAIVAAWDESLEPAAMPSPKAEGKASAHHHGAAMTGLGRVVMTAVAKADDGAFGKAEPVAPRPGSFQLNPALAVASDGAVLFAWNELDISGKRIVLVRRESTRTGGSK